MARRMERRVFSLVSISVFVALVFLASPSWACRIVHPRPWPPPHIHPRVQKPIETKEHRADISISDQMVNVSVEATFHNPNSFQMEGTYFFPLPANVAVNKFSMFIGDKEVKGELLDAKKAAKIYEDIVRSMKDPALLEFVGMQMLKLRVFPILPRSDVKIRLSYNHIVKKDSGMFEYVYPLRSAMPEAGKPIGQVAIRVNLKSTIALKNVYSPTHKIDKTLKDDHHAVVGYEGKNVLPEKDFWLYWSEVEKDMGLNLLTCKPAEEGEDGYFMTMVSPKVEIEEDRVISKDILFILDKSGSMGEDDKIKQAKSALYFCLGKLKEKDRFNIITFGSALHSFKQGMVKATAENVEAARAFAKKIDASGGTAIDEALVAGLKMLSKSENLPMVLFLTDGLPTVGTTDIHQILKNVKEANKVKARFFVFGVGHDVNAKFLDRLAEDERGVREYVRPTESIEVKVSNLYTKVSSPVLSDIKVIYDGVRTHDIYPKEVPDLFRGSQLLLLGRYEGKGEQVIRLQGKIAGKDKEYVYRATYGEKTHEFIPRLWAIRKVGYLLDEIRLHGADDELVKEVKKLGTTYGIVTPYTSFLVVEDERHLPPAQAARAREVLEEREALARNTFEKKEVGVHAQDASMAAESYKAATPGSTGRGGKGFREFFTGADYGGKMTGVTRIETKQVGSKTFLLKSGVWYDSECAEELAEKAIEVKFLSDEYFSLIKKYPAIVKFLSLGDNLVLAWEGEIYKITKE